MLPAITAPHSGENHFLNFWMEDKAWQFYHIQHKQRHKEITLIPLLHKVYGIQQAVMKNRSEVSPSQGSEYISFDTDHIWQICVSPTTKCPVKKISQTSWTIFFQYHTSRGANKWFLMFKDLFLTNTSWLFLALTTCTYHFLEASFYVFEDVSWITPLNWPKNCILNSALIFSKYPIISTTLCIPSNPSGSVLKYIDQSWRFTSAD